jgi:four helix bundle protein
MARDKDVRNNTAWQLAHELNLRVDVFLGCPEFRQRFKCCEQLRAAACSAPRNIAEGYARQQSADCAEFVHRARSSEEQVLTHLIDARRQRLISADELDINRWLTKRAMKAALALLPE